MNTIQDQLTAADAANNDGNYAEAETLCRQLVAQNLQPDEKATALLLLSESLWQRGLVQEALPFAQEALSIAEEIGHKELEAKVLRSIGGVYLESSDYPRALEYYLQALAIFEKLGKTSELAKNFGNIGIVYLYISDFSHSLEYMYKAVELNKKLGRKHNLANNFGNIGSVYAKISDYNNALEYMFQALNLNEELGRKHSISVNLCNIGNVYADLFDYPRALEYYHQALAISQELGHAKLMATIFASIGIIYRELSDYARALEYYYKALSLEEIFNNKFSKGSILAKIANVYQLLSEYPRALEYLIQALTINQELGTKDEIAINLCSLGSLYAKTDFADYNPIKAEEYLIQALSINKELGTKRHLYHVIKSLSDLYKQQARWQEHADYLQQYYDIYQEVQSEETKKLADKFAFQRQIAVMEKEREVTDMLLHKFLPSPIINEVKAKEGKILVQQFNSISVLFADLVGFTKLSLSIKPEIMIEMLNYIFTKFDTNIKEAGGHRIRTMGDGYFAICGAPDLVENHQHKFAKAALAMQQDIILPKHIKQELPEGTILDIRIGLHCGEAVCGMVGGLEKWQYDAYGDTINTASRMESHGEAGKIHISEDFKNSLMDYDEFTFLPREPMFIKGKGLMNTYFLQ